VPQSTGKGSSNSSSSGNIAAKGVATELPGRAYAPQFLLPRFRTQFCVLFYAAGQFVLQKCE